MASLRTNIVLTGVAMVLGGLSRPLFNAVVTRSFGAEVTGHFAALLSVALLAALPATAAIPTVMVRQVSRAIGAGQDEWARGHARWALSAVVLTSVLGLAGALVFARIRVTPFSAMDGAFLAMIVLGYGGWRVLRSLAVSVGEARRSLIADLAGSGALVLGLALAVGYASVDFAAFGFAGVYLGYLVVATPVLLPHFRAEQPLPQAERELSRRYNGLWFVATGCALAPRELAILILDRSEPRAILGEVSTALSLLMMLSLAPRIIELPLIHELSLLGGQKDLARQRQISSRGVQWLSIAMLGAAGAAILLAEPLLLLAGPARDPEVRLAFMILAAAFAFELALTPANNFLVSEADPRVFTYGGVLGLLMAAGWWMTPLGHGVLGVSLGLAASHLGRSLFIATIARRQFGLRLVDRPVAVIAALGLLSVLAALVWRSALSSWLAAAIYAVALLVLFGRDLREIASKLRGQDALARSL